MAKADVQVSFSGRTISVDKQKVKIKKNNDTVEWSGGQSFAIVLPDQTIQAKQNGSQWLASAGPFGNEATNPPIKYDITAPNHDDLDPEIEVLP